MSTIKDSYTHNNNSEGRIKDSSHSKDTSSEDSLNSSSSNNRLLDTVESIVEHSSIDPAVAHTYY